MRRSYIGIAALAFVTACADGPVGPALTELAPSGPNLFVVDNPPPPWAPVVGTGTAYEQVYSWTGHFLANPTNTLAWLQFKSGSGIQFSRDARIMKQGTRVTGFGSATLPDGRKIDLKTINSFDYESWRTTRFLSFSNSDGTFTGGTQRAACEKECAIFSH